MNIYKKIEEIRRKPEHIRLRYVWGLTAVSMAGIVLIWLFSFGSFGKNSKNISPTSNEKSILFEDLNKQKESFQDTTGQIKNMLDQVPSSKGYEENPENDFTVNYNSE